MDNVTNEEIIWRTYPDYPFIEANQFGEIRTKDRVVIRSNGIKYHVKGRALKQHPNNHGYMKVNFNVCGKIINLLVQRIIATCFIPNPNDLPEVNHIDCDKTNNRWDNLEWCSHQENIAYRDKLGHTVNNNPGHSVIAINEENFEVFYFESQREAARQLDVDQSSVTKVTKGKQNRAGSFWFCDVDENAVGKIRSKFGDDIAEKVEKLMSENNKNITNTRK